MTMGTAKATLAAPRRNGSVSHKALNEKLFETGCNMLRTTTKIQPDQSSLEFLLAHPEILKAERNGESIAKLSIRDSSTTEQFAFRLIHTLGSDLVSRMRDRTGESLAAYIHRRFPSERITALLRMADSMTEPLHRKIPDGWWSRADS
jgi:hypothetical protein